MCPAALDLHPRPLAQPKAVHLCERLRGKVVRVVNTAGRGAYTPQYDGVEKRHARYRDRGLVVAGFPSNDCAGQEPGSEQPIRDFCRLTCGVTFPMFGKQRVMGATADPFYRHLARLTGESPRWNFHKYPLDGNGRVVDSLPSQVMPDDPRLTGLIEDLL